MIKYMILHLSTGMYIYRSILDYYGGKDGSPLYGEFYSEWEVENHSNKDFSKVFDNMVVFNDLRRALQRQSKEAYFSYEKTYDKKSINRIEHFELIEVEISDD